MQNLKDMSLDDLPAETQKEIMAIMARAVAAAKQQSTQYVDVQKIHEYLRVENRYIATDAELEVLDMARTFNDLVIAIIEDNHAERASACVLMILEMFLKWQKLSQREQLEPF